MKTPKKSMISTSVMEQIKQGDVHMRSRVYFTLLLVASALGIALSGLFISYLISIMFFWLRIQNADTMAWGARANLSESLSSFPWWAPLLAIVAFALAVWLVRKQGTMYRHKTGSVLFIVVLISLVVGFSMSSLGIGTTHSDNSQQLQRGQNQRTQIR